MNLLSTFLGSYALPSLEKALENHEPQIQEAILKEIEQLAMQFGLWLEGRLNKK